MKKYIVSWHLAIVSFENLILKFFIEEEIVNVPNLL